MLFFWMNKNYRIDDVRMTCMVDFLLYTYVDMNVRSVYFDGVSISKFWGVDAFR